MKCLVVDDHPVFRRGVKELLSDYFPGIEVDQAGNFKEAINKVRSKRYDVALLDISMPDINGLSLLLEIKREFPKMPVLMLSAYPEEQYAIRAIKSGASGYSTKKEVGEDLVDAIKKIIKGEVYLTTNVAQQLALEVKGERDEIPHERLSRRELEVLLALASGKRVSDVATALSISVKTVSTYRTNILHKMGMNSNAELTYYAVKNGLVD